MPTVARLMPTWLNHAESVLKISMKGRPLEKPQGEHREHARPGIDAERFQRPGGRLSFQARSAFKVKIGWATTKEKIV